MSGITGSIGDYFTRVISHGFKTYTFFDESRVNKDTGKPRRLKTEIWYPAVQSAKDGPFYTYDLKDQSQGEDLGEYREVVENRDMPKLETRTVRDALMDLSNGPYPIIMFSHGANGIRFQSTFYTPHLASHGYIVISTDHETNTLWDIIRDGYSIGSVIASAPHRLDDTSFLLDRVIEFNKDAEHFFYQSMDEDQVGITGHSFGGFTSIAVPCVDDRFKVAIPHAPVIGLGVAFGCDFDNYPVPALVIGGTADRTVEYDDTYCDYRTMKGSEKYLLEIQKGGHYTFSDMCTLDLAAMAEDLDFGDATSALSDGCSPSADENIPYPDGHRITNYYATAYFNYYLRGSVASMDYIHELDEHPFSESTLYSGDDLPDWPDGGCGK